MTDIRLTQGQVFALAEGGDIRITQSQTLAVYNFPTPALRATQAEIKYAVKASLDLRVTQTQVLAAVLGRTDNRRLRAWTFTLDGHDFYVLRLGEDTTLVYDLKTEQWSEWKSKDIDFWRAQIGTNWLGADNATFVQGFNTNVVTGDDAFGILWLLDPEQGYDDDPRGSATPQLYPRKATGSFPARMLQTLPCYAAYATISLGNPADASAEITLRTSDTQGQDWIDHGALQTAAGTYRQRIVWRSLGLIRQPGRIFSIEDDGAAARVDGLDIDIGPEEAQ